MMQPSFPASVAKKIYWREQARREIKKASKEAEVIIISHYHYDHFTDFDKGLYENKLVLTKNPNEYINESQRKRAESFFGNICKAFGGVELEHLTKTKKEKKYPDPLDNLPLAKSKDFGDYNKRRHELLEKGRKWFYDRVKSWNKNKEIPELKFDKIEVKFPEQKKFKFGKTTLRFTRPMFHGIEYARVGWVFVTVVEYGDEKFIHTSDLEGPAIEDQVEWLIQENPDVLIVDGPSTYLVPYMLNLINLRRAIVNLCQIIKETETELIILDHHLLRERRYKKRLEKVYELAEKQNRRVISCAEYLGKIPKVLEV